MSHPPLMNGFLNVNKPLSLTSHDVVARIRRIYKRDTISKSVGHAGTLDPLATGVLILCLGQATRLSDYVMHAAKYYRADIHFGVSTNTYDAEGQVTATVDASHITLADIQTILPQFTGDILQVPPMHSAIKIDGQKLYNLARQGKEIERPPRPIHIAQLEIVTWQAPHLTLDITCGAGTYIRSLAYDMGQTLGVGAHLTALQRRSSGTFDIAQSIDLEQVLMDPEWYHHLIPPHIALTDYPSLYLTPPESSDLQYGRTIPRTQDHPAPNADALAMAYLPDNHLLAILHAEDDLWRPRKVFLPDTR